jgi:hypothetical protein
LAFNLSFKLTYLLGCTERRNGKELVHRTKTKNSTSMGHACSRDGYTHRKVKVTFGYGGLNARHFV